MPTTTNYGWTTPADTDLVKDGASAIRTLGTAIDTTVFNNAGAAIAKTIVDAKGDLIAATAADTPARLAVGSNGQLLAANSATATGLEWQTVSGGGITLISETTASGLSSLSLSSIPTTYKDLLLVWHGLYTSSTGLYELRFNNDSNSNYTSHYYQFGPTGTVARSSSSVASGGSYEIAFCFPNTDSTDYPKHTQGSLKIYNYASTSKHKKYDIESGGFRDTIGARGGFTSGTYRSTSAVTSIDVILYDGSGTFSNATNTSIRLYGIS